jgi:hypothetical protein
MAGLTLKSEPAQELVSKTIATRIIRGSRWLIIALNLA